MELFVLCPPPLYPKKKGESRPPVEDSDTDTTNQFTTSNCL
jgi:hypothetical protein